MVPLRPGWQRWAGMGTAPRRQGKAVFVCRFLGSHSTPSELFSILRVRSHCPVVRRLLLA
ncbi:hypothetical protein BDV98DRAFT_578332 [Pterulicium gracile]|uniref:Uncharacterized protein n=1 Tax=Pterulicium gracile TaxID=1884261 RepID=A0A5C3PZ27_9AGAR|nr:hypothetical protein BDV98DRAFT_578332 [Pterula gracilis]